TVAAVLAGETQRIPQKRILFDFDRTKPLLLQGNGGLDSAFLLRAVITPYINGIPDDGFYAQRDSAGMRLFAANKSIEQLYVHAFLKLYPDSFSKLDLSLLLVKGGVWESDTGQRRVEPKPYMTDYFLKSADFKARN